MQLKAFRNVKRYKNQTNYNFVNYFAFQQES